MSNGHEHDGSQVLLEAARPDLYQRNAFRVTELPVDATARDFTKRQHLMDMATKTGLAIPPGPSRIFPLQHRDNLQAVRDAMRRLRDPELRLVDEFFWFWPHQLGESHTDDALVALAQADHNRAVDIWHGQEANVSDSCVSTHNMAVVRHLSALDWELLAQGRSLTAEETEYIGSSWQSAFKRWRLLLDHEGFWSRLTARIRDLDDPRLTTGTARRIRASLPLALLSINAHLAVQAAERGDPKAVQRQLRNIRLWEQPDPSKPPPLQPSPLITQALQRAADPIRERIKLLCKTAETEADKDPAHADQVTKRLLEQTGPSLALLRCLFGQAGGTATALTGQVPPKLRDRNPATGNAFCDGAHDEVAQRALTCQIQFGNKTENWRTSKELLESVLCIAVSESLRTRIQENLKTVEGNLELDTCWFCGKNPSDKSAVIEVKMHGDVQRVPFYDGYQSGTRITWKYGTRSVPRCAACKTAHAKEGNWTGCGAGIGGLAGLIGCIGAASADSPGWGFLTLIALLAVGAGIGNAIGASKRPAGIKPESAHTEFPTIKKALAEGWQFGEKPSDTN